MKAEILFPVVLVALVGIGFSPAPTLAQTDAQKAKARQHFQNGRRYYDVGRYQEAIREYEQAYLNVEDPVFLFNIAQAYRLDGQLEEAIRSYRAYLRRAPDAQNRADVEARIAELQKEVEAQKQKASQAASPPVTVPAVQPAPVPTPAPVPAEPTATARPAAALPPLDVAAAVSSDASGDAAARRLAGRRRTGYILLASGGGGILLATIFGVIANGKANELEKADVFDKDIEDAGKMASAGAVLFGLGGTIAAGIGVYFLMSNQRAAPGAQAATGARPAGTYAGGALALTPVVAPGYTGVGAALRF